MATLWDLGVSAFFNILSAFAFLPAFALLRLQPINDRVYFLKWYLKGQRTSPSRGANGFVGKFVNLNARTYLSFLDWMPRALRMSENELIEHAGLDSAVFLRIYILGLKILAPMLILGILILVPVNFSGGNLVFSLVAISNVEPKSYNTCSLSGLVSCCSRNMILLHQCDCAF